MNATHVVTSELILASMLAGCASVPIDQACRAGIEKERDVFITNGHTRQYHRSRDFAVLLAEAEVGELNGDYQSCVDNLSMARRYGHRHEYGTGYASASNNRQHVDSRNSGNRSAGRSRGGGRPGGGSGD